MKKFNFIRKNITMVVALSGVLVISGFGMLFNKAIKKQNALNSVIITKQDEIKQLREKSKKDDAIIKKVNAENTKNKTELNKVKNDLNKMNKEYKKVSDELTKTKECLRQRTIALQNRPNQRISRGNLGRTKTMKVIFTFYTNLPEENGGYYNITSSGKRLADGMVASINELPIGSILISKRFGRLVVEDRMSRKVGLGRCKNGEIPVDVYVPRNRGESRGHYYRRVNNMGIIRETIVVYY